MGLWQRDEAPRFGREKSSGEWNLRLGGNTEVANKLDFLRDRTQEDRLRRTAEKEAASKVS